MTDGEERQKLLSRDEPLNPTMRREFGQADRSFVAGKVTKVTPGHQFARYGDMNEDV